MANPNFGAILDRPSAEVERPKALPVGSYVALIQGQPRYGESSKKKTEQVEFDLKLLQAMDDVDEDDLREALTRKDGSTKTLGDIKMKVTYYLTEDALWRLKDFLNHAQVEEGDLSLRQRITEAPGHQVGIVIKHDPSDDGESVFAKVGRTMAVE